MSLYLFLTSRAAGNEDVIDRYDWDKNQVTLLASTRRQPAQNQFDNRTQLVYAQIYDGPEGKPCLTTMDGTYYVQETSGTWPEVFDSVRAAYSTPVGSATLVVGGAGEVVLLDPSAHAAVPLMAPAQPTFRKPPTPGNKPVKELPSWAAQAPWDAPTGVRFYYTNVAYHRDSLYIVQEPTVKGGDYTLFCFQKGKGRNARKISLRFQLDDKRAQIWPPSPTALPRCGCPHRSSTRTPTNIPAPACIFSARKLAFVSNRWIWVSGICPTPISRLTSTRWRIESHDIPTPRSRVWIDGVCIRSINARRSHCRRQ